jgi:hypothetical protein
MVQWTSPVPVPPARADAPAWGSRWRPRRAKLGPRVTPRALTPVGIERRPIGPPAPNVMTPRPWTMRVKLDRRKMPS